MLKISYGIRLIIFVAQFVPTNYFHINRFDFYSDKLEIMENVLAMRYKFIEYILEIIPYIILHFIYRLKLKICTCKILHCNHTFQNNI